MSKFVSVACLVGGALGLTPQVSLNDALGAACQVLDMAEYRCVVLEPVSGVIESVNDEAMTFVLKTEDGEALTISVNDATSYTLNGNESTRQEALIITRTASVTHEMNVASRVDVTVEADPPAGKDGKDGKGID